MDMDNGRITVSEDEVWAEIDKYFSSSDKQPDEYDVKFFVEKYGMKKRSTFEKLRKLEKTGLVTSRLAIVDSRVTRVWKISTEIPDENDEENED